MLISALLLAFSLSVWPVVGEVPLSVVAQVHVTGPYNGPVCMVILQHKKPVAGPFCSEKGPFAVKDGYSLFVDIELTAVESGQYELMAVGDRVESNLVTVTVH